MSLRNAVTLLILASFGAFQVVRAQTTEELNLGFEQVGEKPSKPKAWTTSGDGFATDAPGYQVGLDEAESKSGKRSLRMKSTGQGSFGNAYLTIPGNVAAGKHVKISGWIKTKDVAPAGYAGLWCRLDGPGGLLAHDNSVARIDAKGKVTIDDRGIRGTTDWKLRSVEHDVPSSARTAANSKTSGPIAPSRTWSRRQASAGRAAASAATERTASRLGRLGGWPAPE